MVSDDEITIRSRKGSEMLKAPKDMIIVEPIYDDKAHGSSVIFAPDRDQNYIGEFHGIVASVGHEYLNDLKPGDKVKFRRHEGAKINYQGTEYLSLKARWVVALEERGKGYTWKPESKSDGFKAVVYEDYKEIQPLGGMIFCKPILGQFETDSGLVVVKDLKRNNKIEKVQVISTGKEFMVCSRCRYKYEDPTRDCPKHKSRVRFGKYWADRGSLVWMKRAHLEKYYIGAELFCFIKNDDIVAST